MIELAGWLIETTIVISALVAVVLLLRGPLACAANVRWAYVLWSVPAGVLVLRLLPDTARAVPAGLADAAGLGGFVPSIGSGWLSTGSAAVLLAIWVLGFGVSAARLVVAHVRARRFYLRDQRRLSAADHRLLVHYCERMQIFPVIDCVETPTAEGPALLGLFRPTLLLPVGFMRSCAEPELVIRHELVHYRRRDPIFNVLAAVLRCVFWFNPLAHIAERHYRDDQEVACDRAVIADIASDQRYGYGRALVRAVVPQPGSLTGFMATQTALKRRLLWLDRHRVNLRREATGALAIAALALGGIALGVDAPAYAFEWSAPLTFPGPLPGNCGG